MKNDSTLSDSIFVTNGREIYKEIEARYQQNSGNLAENFPKISKLYNDLDANGNLTADEKDKIINSINFNLLLEDNRLNDDDIERIYNLSSQNKALFPASFLSYQTVVWKFGPISDYMEDRDSIVKDIQKQYSLLNSSEAGLVDDLRNQSTNISEKQIIALLDQINAVKSAFKKKLISINDQDTLLSDIFKNPWNKHSFNVSYFKNIAIPFLISEYTTLNNEKRKIEKPKQDKRLKEDIKKIFEPIVGPSINDQEIDKLIKALRQIKEINDLKTHQDSQDRNNILKVIIEAIAEFCRNILSKKSEVTWMDKLDIEKVVQEQISSISKKSSHFHSHSFFTNLFELNHQYMFANTIMESEGNQTMNSIQKFKDIYWGFIKSPGLKEPQKKIADITDALYKRGLEYLRSDIAKCSREVFSDIVETKNNSDKIVYLPMSWRLTPKDGGHTESLIITKNMIGIINQGGGSGTKPGIRWFKTPANIDLIIDDLLNHRHTDFEKLCIYQDKWNSFKNDLSKNEIKEFYTKLDYQVTGNCTIASHLPLIQAVYMYHEKLKDLNPDIIKESNESIKTVQKEGEDLMKDFERFAKSCSIAQMISKRNLEDYGLRNTREIRNLVVTALAVEEHKAEIDMLKELRAGTRKTKESKNTPNANFLNEQFEKVAKAFGIDQTALREEVSMLDIRDRNTGKVR